MATPPACLLSHRPSQFGDVEKLKPFVMRSNELGLFSSTAGPVKGCERNPVARRIGVLANLVADIESKMTRGAQAQGARELEAAF